MDDERYYEAVAREVAQGEVRPGLWAKALSAPAGDPNALWPPNHRLIPVNAVVTGKDTETGSGWAGFTLTSVTSNEPDNGLGDGDTANDIQGFVFGTPDIAGQLRAERSGTGNGRIYTFVYKGTDVAGNSMNCTTTVVVPHDQGK